MNIGIICEYNPLHLGHQKQLQAVRREFGPDCGIVCLMSGNYVQRGQPAVLDKSVRAEAAVLSGADLVLELPLTVSLSSAEGFAAGGVRILSPICDGLCFGAETGDRDSLMGTAQALLSPRFSGFLREGLDRGLSFPAARQQALANMGLSDALVSQPNDILGVEYCKAILSQGSHLVPYPIHRPGSYHASEADAENPSATALRRRMLNGESWLEYVPQEARAVFRDAPLHSLAAGERAVLSLLRTMTEEEFQALPFGSEGLWRKFMHACRQRNSLENILVAVKSKRYTRTRLDRMAMCAALGLTHQDMEQPPPYTRVLAFNHKGRAILKDVKGRAPLLHAGEAVCHPYWEIEQRAQDLYALFRVDCVDPAGLEPKRRIIYVNR